MFLLYTHLLVEYLLFCGITFFSGFFYWCVFRCFWKLMRCVNHFLSMLCSSTILCAVFVLFLPRSWCGVFRLLVEFLHVQVSLCVVSWWLMCIGELSLERCKFELAAVHKIQVSLLQLFPLSLVGMYATVWPFSPSLDFRLSRDYFTFFIAVAGGWSLEL
jgi:hypothetical protein